MLSSSTELTKNNVISLIVIAVVQGFLCCLLITLSVFYDSSIESFYELSFIYCEIPFFSKTRDIKLFLYIKKLLSYVTSEHI